MLSVLSVEPYGMKHSVTPRRSAVLRLSVLSVEPYGMKLDECALIHDQIIPFSALGRAVWDETAYVRPSPYLHIFLSVLSVEPYGMKPRSQAAACHVPASFSALGRAVWDETNSL